MTLNYHIKHPELNATFILKETVGSVCHSNTVETFVKGKPGLTRDSMTVPVSQCLFSLLESRLNIKNGGQ